MSSLLLGCQCSQASSVENRGICLWVYVCEHTCTHIFMSLRINRCKCRSIIKYAHLYLFIYMLKTTSSPWCLQFQSNVKGSFSASMYSPIARILSPTVSHPTRGCPVRPTTVTAVPNPTQMSPHPKWALKPSPGLLPPLPQGSCLAQPHVTSSGLN